jgi:hypothetical protein
MSRVAMSRRPAPAHSLGQHVHVGRLRAGWRGHGHTQGAEFVLQQRIGEAAGRHVPAVGGDQATRTHHARHLGHAQGRVAQEEDDQRHARHIELRRAIGQGHGVALHVLGLRRAGTCAGEVQLLRGRVDARQ